MGLLLFHFHTRLLDLLTLLRLLPPDKERRIAEQFGTERVHDLDLTPEELNFESSAALLFRVYNSAARAVHEAATPGMQQAASSGRPQSQWLARRSVDWGAFGADFPSSPPASPPPPQPEAADAEAAGAHTAAVDVEDNDGEGSLLGISDAEPPSSPRAAALAFLSSVASTGNFARVQGITVFISGLLRQSCSFTAVDGLRVAGLAYLFHALIML